MTELEKKLLLTEDEYDYLMEHLGYESPLIQKPIITQINYYFDTDDFSMNRQNTTCRIRLKDGKYKGIMKQHSIDSDQSIETEVEVYDGLISNTFTEMGLKLQGELITERCIIWQDTYCEVVLDKNEYLGHVDYELEIEYLSNYEEYALLIFRLIQDVLTRREYFLDYKESGFDITNVPCKSSRFFKRKSSAYQSLSENINNVGNNELKVLKESDFETQNQVNNYQYQDPDDYMSDYVGSIFPNINMCVTCVHFNGSSCQSPSGLCIYTPT